MRAIVALTAAVSVLTACGGAEDAADLGVDERAESTTTLLEVRELPHGEEAFNQRPASCSTTHAVLIAGGRPTPQKLRVRSGACVIWGNKTGRDVHVVSVQPHPEGGRTTHSTLVPARSASYTHGPLERLTPARAVIDANRRRQKKFCSYSAIGLGDPRTNTPVEYPYTITPHGARGRIIVAPPTRTTATRPPARIAPDLQALRHLRCGDVLLEERSASCEVTKAVLIAHGKPRPSNLQLKNGRAVCLLWGNQDDKAVVAEPAPQSARPRAAHRRGKRVVRTRPFREHVVCRSDFDIVDVDGHLEMRKRAKKTCTRSAGAPPAQRNVGTSIPARTAVELTSFIFTRPGARAGGVAYTLQPSGAKTTIGFE